MNRVWRWARYALLTPLLLSLTAASASPDHRGLPDVIEAGNVAKGLSESQTALYFMMILLALSVIERLWGRMQDRADRRLQIDAMNNLADALTLNSTDIKVQLALILLTLGHKAPQPGQKA